ncbi:AAA family ATPase [Chryseobacterium indologenes]|uniref:AAA family ATPase n=1 Tax=Chryseobacterium indologenes TaxID=253 RepID=UPI00237C3400|nr:AAA family ATPase [Chryseobacterium indologenes]
MNNNLKIISASDFNKLISSDLVFEAIEFIQNNNIELIKSTKYSIMIGGKTYPPKEIMRYMAQLRQYKIDESTLYGGKVNKPFQDLGFEIITNKDYSIVNLDVLKSCVIKYNYAISNTEWLKTEEIYKFNFIDWVQKNIDFQNDLNEEIKSKIELSQKRTYSPNSTIKGVNFIQTIIRYQDNFVTIEDLLKIKQIVNGEISLNKENLTLSFNSFPKTSAFLSFYKPERFIAYDNESLPSHRYLTSIQNAPKRDFKAFTFYQEFYMMVKELLKESTIDVQKILEILNIEELTELHWNFIAQDFLLYVTRKIMSVNTLQKKYDFFIKHEKLENWEWYQDIKFYTEVIAQLQKNCEQNKYSSYTELNSDYKIISNNINGDFLERYLFMSSNGFSTVRNQLIKLTVRQKIREKVSKDFSVLLNILLEKDIHKCFKKIQTLIEGNNWTVIYRFLRALFPYNLTSVDAPNQFDSLLKKLNDDFEIAIAPDDQINKNKEVLDQISYQDIYKAQIFFWMYRIENNTNNTDPSQDSEIADMTTKFPLNQILYGAPGTGKTYLTKKIAVEIINGVRKRNRTEILNEYEDLKNLGHIKFTTFHQSMSYEDFVEGIRPEEVNGQIIYEKKPGIFKELCTVAKSANVVNDSIDINFDNCNYFKMSLGGLQNLEKHQWSVDNGLIFLGWGDDKDFTEFKNIEEWTVFRDKFKEKYPELVKESKYVIQAVFWFQRMKIGDIVLVSKGNKIIDAVGVVESDYFYDDSKNFDNYQFRKVKWLATDLNVNSNVFVSKGISQQTIYQFYDKDVKKDVLKEMFKKEKHSVQKKFVLIIDEINRGNVSAIFGELITLLEADKRKGVYKNNDEYIETILPYSNEVFSVPDNLYIIGTMNTADRSVEAMDTALRRRFSFTEMPSDPDLVKADKIIYDTLWQYEDIGWDDSRWIEVENGLKELFEFNLDWEDDKRELWDSYTKEGYNINDAEKLNPYFKERINLNTILKTINDRIEFLIDKDHQIGHSYLFKVKCLKDLSNVFANNIIPLLEEYFYGDYGKIGLVLGGGFVTSETINGENILAQNFSYNAEILDEKEVFKFTPQDSWNLKTFTSIYNAEEDVQK